MESGTKKFRLPEQMQRALTETVRGIARNFLSTLLPARKAASIDPIQALRSELGESTEE